MNSPINQTGEFLRYVKYTSKSLAPQQQIQINEALKLDTPRLVGRQTARVIAVY